ncbi:Antitoxin Phd_YefM, type II toxin-antitoxin system [Candidatus Aquiluna sp. UB-MaderosW2red]|jgi:antitoxin (DNA-binding transcriptional repressor) of toxin-antitoxin stability system|nr:Antitoxin Phd_YefM, type II toxin-antitoxin system [Candidatus Aquiluna sp. UB-MaderosW2red]
MLLIEQNKSDNLIHMKKEMSATEVARNFSAVLDSVEAGAEIEITRGKKVIARITPEKKVPNGAALLAFMNKWQAEHEPMDDETYALYQEILAERRAPHNLIGDPEHKDPWAE